MNDTRTTDHRQDSELLRVTDRLRGKVVLRVNDGAGPLNGKDYFERSFPTSKLAVEAADEIDRLRGWLSYIAGNFRDGRECAFEALSGNPLPEDFEHG